jgi:glycosyltransferase involved in cell wall biosynthesis
MFLNHTINDILAHAEGDTNIIVALDGSWPVEPIPDNPRVILVHFSEPIGQRAATNVAARISQSKYLMKCDAHCAFDQGFDVKMITDMQDDWTMVATMRNLHVFDWVCPDGHRRYQGNSGPCETCGKETTRDIVWIAKTNPQSRSYCFDSEPRFQYFRDYSKRSEGKGDLTETMSLQGSCWLLTREKYFELNVCDESWGFWGSQGIEVACKTWLSGGRVVVNNKTWYAHAFRSKGGDWGFPYDLSGSQVEHAKQMARETFFENKWPKQIYPLSWLLEKFWPIPGWTEADLLAQKQRENHLTGAILYYTCNTHPLDIETACRKQLLASKNGHELGCVSLKPTEFGDWNITLPLERSPLSMHKQILAGLERLTADYVFLVESDVLYHPSHFRFIPPRADVFYYNTNVWKVRYPDGHAVWTDYLQQVSGLCASRELLLEFYRKRVEEIERDGFNRHYEPGPKTGNYRAVNWQSEVPNLDIRHTATLTHAKWSPDEFRNSRYSKGWKESDRVPFWGITENRFEEVLNGNFVN